MEAVTGGELSAAQAAQLGALEEEVVAGVEAAVAQLVQEAIGSEEVQQRIQVWAGFRGLQGGGAPAVGRLVAR